ncbi:uncharacterized protein EDB93DRAFT_1101185 [Suillus bovinus]|uniref:uncharacterized protein n=1 Tax=Suillus bovinus TaxID=48563 RepID=UPI001B877109|nr:uncharacterized protein EDB93DRAFT_1101185 [Suillus bovinus]KAG2156748.1 hypothetical protein EDB93DRAFT_1101185 [Suillus bovinus]
MDDAPDVSEPEVLDVKELDQENEKDEDDAGLDTNNDNVLSKKQTKKNNADDLLTIFSECITVKFCSPDGEVATKVGHWCLECSNNATKLDLPSTHNIMTHVHNSFINFFSKLKSDVQASLACTLGIIWVTISLDCVNKLESFQDNHLSFSVLSLITPATMIQPVTRLSRFFTAVTSTLSIQLNTASYASLMSSIIKIINVVTTMAIWEFDPMLPNNHVLGDLLDVVAVVQTLSIKVQQRVVLALLPYQGFRLRQDQVSDYKGGDLIEQDSRRKPSNKRLRSYIKKGNKDREIVQPIKIAKIVMSDGGLLRSINMFVKLVDKLFRPVNTIQHPGSSAKHIPWKTFTIGSVGWEHINATWNIISDANNIQQYFFSELQPTLW